MIPTAKEFSEKIQYDLEYHNEGGCQGIELRSLEKYLIEFAKLHVTEALKQASEKLTMKIKEDVQELEMNDDWMEVDKKSILNAYNLDEIK